MRYPLSGTRRKALARLALLLLSVLGAGVVIAAKSAKVATGPTPPISWPLELMAEGKRLAVFQPQIRSWEDHKQLVGVSALAFYPDARKEDRHLGWMKLTADTDADLDRRLARISNIQVAEVQFPGLTSDEAKFRAAVEKLIPEDVVVELDRLTAGVELSQLRQKQQELKSDPPRIFLSFQPAILLLLDGKPIASPVQGVEGLEFVVNTNWDLFKTGGTYYLRNGGSWLQAKEVEGPWQPAGKLPKVFQTIPRRDQNWTDVILNIPGKKISADEMPKVFTSLEPAELLLVDGKPRYEPVADTGLLWLANTDADVFRDGPEGDHYYLVSGRWFRAKTLEDATWTFATPELPKAFKHIPEDHPRADVLASVPGTVAATEAIVLAAIPQKATIKRKETAAPKVEYVGEPQFEPIPETSVSRAVNTQYDVLMVGSSYYLCHQGVWFLASAPTGPWEVATTVPSDIYTIPASSPSHNVTYVQVYDSTPDEVVMGYTAGYMGVYWGWGVMMYGSGWYYPPYWYGGYYYPYWPTYGMAAYYNPATGMYGRGAFVYGPYGGAGRAAFYNPSTGTYARAGAAYGPYRSGAWASAYNPRTGTSARTIQGASAYGDWGTSVVRNGDDWVRTGHVSGDNGSLRGFKTSEGGSGFVGRHGDDIYAGGDGNVYRRQDGEWQKYENGGWTEASRPGGDRPSQGLPSDRPAGADRPSQGGPSTRPAGGESRPGAGTSDLSTPRDLGNTPTRSQLDRDAYNRARGASTASRSANWRGSGSMNRPSYGGGMRGGGMRGGGRRR